MIKNRRLSRVTVVPLYEAEAGVDGKLEGVVANLGCDSGHGQ